MNQPREETGIDRKIAPLGIKGRGRLGRHDLVPRSSLLLEVCDAFSDGDEHVAELFQLGLVADGMTVSWDDDCLVCRYRQVGVGLAPRDFRYGSFASF